ncbi:MAG TPA: hypothetical protein VFL41_04530 [Gaiellaceae bacterium]|nr:hypothetical protein [Gaiellaceae bacterium]HET8651528.1 hypothetical protein [Gaiellaceae bacterium]
MQATASRAHAASPELERASPATTALIAGVLGLLANVAYFVASALPHDASAVPVVASLIGPLIAGASVALYLLLSADRATLTGQLAAFANVAAGALVTAMLLVQLAVDDVEAELTPAVNDAFEHVEFGLDLSWDVFLVAGTILFGCAMLGDPRFGRWFGVSGIAVAAALYVLNFATFPTPPASDGLVDLGPAVGLWYAAVSIQALRIRRQTPSGRRE